MVLVVGILVLLVIIATSYVTRTHAGRLTAVSQQRAALRDDNAQVIAESLAGEIASALFPHPIDPRDPALGSFFPKADTNYPRLAATLNPVRYGVDQDAVDNTTGVPVPDGLPDFPYNFAPYQVVPFTNWPDPDPTDPITFNWPRNPGGSVGKDLLTLLGVGEGNPVGNPGFGDARWLADTEPLRVVVAAGDDGVFGTDDDVEAFSHWRHMTYLAHPNSGWRLVGDLSDVAGSLVTDMTTPVEQFLTLRTDSVHPSTLLPQVRPDFLDRWRAWFRPASAGLLNYATSYTIPGRIPPNVLDLKDLDGDGLALEDSDLPGEDIDERPEHEFEPGTARHTVGRVLADADGDGFTDSFWFLAPTMIEGGIRQVVAARIVDNSGLLNANVATRFLRNDIDFGAEAKTRGRTPADLALVGELGLGGFGGTWNVGFYDNPLHWFVGPDRDNDGRPDYVTAYDLPEPDEATDADFPWLRHVSEVGLVDSFGNPILTPDQGQRLDYWRRAGLAPVGGGTGSGYGSFTLADEIELRMFNGQNYPWIFSRYEFSTQSVQADPFEQFLRAKVERSESSEYLDQLSNVELVADHRRQLTLVSGARNDLMPPWLWANLFPFDFDSDGTIDADELQQYRADMRKLDLRKPESDRDVDNDGEVETPSGFNDPTDDDLNDDFVIDARDHHLRLRDYLERALIDTDESYLEGDEDETRRLAAGFAANIAAGRDPDADAPLAEAVPVSNDPNTRFLGLERQPFILEAFIGHVYKAKVVPPAGPNSIPYVNAGNNVILENPSRRSTIIVVQLANPFDRSVDLAGYKLFVFGQDLDLSTVGIAATLPPATDDIPRTLVAYAMEATLDGDPLSVPWRNFLDFENLAAGGIVADVGTTWLTDRGRYDGAGGDAIALLRTDPTGSMVVVDRIDPPGDRDFGDAVSIDLSNDTPPLEPVTDPPGPGPYPGIDLGPSGAGSYDHWVDWVRVTRAWGFDVDVSGTNDLDERNPRYVFGGRAVVFPTAATIPDGTFIAGGNKYRSAESPETPWFQRNYVRTDGSTAGRKPTFFDMNGGATSGYPNKGWYGQLSGGNGSVDVDPTIDPKLDFSMQMRQKDGDFEQIGELLDIWLFGHELDSANSTTRTFSEIMMQEPFVGDDVRVNRLRVVPDTFGGSDISPVIGVADASNLSDSLHAVPALPAGARVLEAFVCDGSGVAPLTDLNGDGSIDEADAELRRYRNADDFSGRATPGLINVNTAPREVLRALPHAYQLVHEIATPIQNPRVRLPEAVVKYRERLASDPANPSDARPDYSDRDSIAPELRPERGVASIGELMLLNETPANAPPAEPLYTDSWQVDFAGLDPFVAQSTRISTDLHDPEIGGTPQPDEVAGDAEEVNLLFAGLANLITTRSDVFTVYFKIRSFRLNPTTRFWDATDPEYIVDDSRYVMLVDRSEVDAPYDEPRILYVEKLPK
jgi:hypothetical protein